MRMYDLVKLHRRIKTKINTLFLRSIFLHIGKNVTIDSSVWYDYPEKIHLEDDVDIRRGCIVIGNSQHDVGIYMDKGVHLHQYAYLNAYGGFIRLGKGVRIGQFAVLAGQGGITFGDYSGVAGLSYVIASNHLFKDSTVPFILQDVSKKGINVGKNVWGAAGITVLDGVTIGDNVVIGAGSVVHTNIPDNSVVLGNPARIAYRFNV
jgi:acetyltransferase-like isoleucine patch superfamily enzyme